MTRKAFVHVGMSKTGTTAIQQCLSGSRDRVRQHGLWYPGTTVDHVLLVPSFHQAGTNHEYFRRKGIPPEQAMAMGERFLGEIDRIAKEFEGALLFSSEYLQNLNHDALRKLDGYFSAIGYELVIVCYLRHPVAMAISSAQQTLKTGRRVLSEIIDDPKWHSIIATLKPPLEVIGRGRIIVRNFDEAKSVGTGHDILQAIGYAGPLNEIEQQRVNTSLSMPAALLADAHNRLAKSDPSFASRRRYLLRVSGPKFTLPEEALALVRRECQHEVDWVRDQFGIRLEESPASKWGENALTEDAARDIVSLILTKHRKGSESRFGGEFTVDDVGSHQKEITEIFAGKTSYLGEEPIFQFPLVLICFTNRCGSNILSEYLRQTGNFSGLYEHLNGFAVRSMVQATKATTFPDHVAAIVNQHKKDAATFGFKASWDQLLMLLRWRIDRMFSSLHVIHMERLDLLAQAVSFSIADQTKKWTSTQSGIDIEPQYNASDISNRINGIGNGNLMIRKVCLVHDLDWIRLVYENVMATPISELERIHKWLDLSLLRVNLRRARMSKQSDGINDEFIARFRADAFATLERQPVRPPSDGARASAGL